jgi:hypothetical protein
VRKKRANRTTANKTTTLPTNQKAKPPPNAQICVLTSLNCLGGIEHPLKKIKRFKAKFGANEK